MAGSKSTYLTQLQDIWTRLDKAQRVTVGLLGVLVFAGLAVLIFFMNRVEYEVLYRDLNAEDAQAIAAKLKEEKRDYLVQGTSILVAASKTDADKLRLEIAGSGLARSGRVGYEIFDKNQFGMTDFTEQVYLQRALEGELARTITSLTEISQARVHLVLPKDSIFEDKKEEAKASVAVRLKRGSELSKSSISGIKGLVANAVPGLRNYNVSIVDEEGRLLSQSLGSPDAARAETESGIREQLEKEMVSKVVSMLEPALGKGKVHANASIDLDFNTTEQTEETYNPTPAAIASQQKSEERLGGTANPSGVPGVQNNLSSYSPSTSPDRSRQSEITNYEISKMVRHTLQPKGTIRRISVAVLLDNRMVQTIGPDGKIITTSQKLSQQDLDAYRELVYAAVGYDKERGDIVTLENVPFFNELRPREEIQQTPWYIRWQSYLLPSIKYASFLVLFVLVYLILFRPITKRVYKTMEAITPPLTQEAEARIGASEDMTGKALPSAEQTEEIAALDAATQAASARPEGSRGVLATSAIDDQIENELMRDAQMLDMGARKFSVLKRKLSERAQTEPEMVSQLIRSWIQER